VNPEAAVAEAERRRGLRALHLSEDWSGMLRLSGLLDPASALEVLPVIRALSDPANLNPGDTRIPAQARADALVEVCRAFRQGDGQSGRRPARVLVTIPWKSLWEGTGIVDTEAGPIGAGTARRLACDASVRRVLLDARSVPVEMGQATRVVSSVLREALELRDGGCAHPGCQRPARWTDARHIVHWADGGPTALSNLQLLCTHHHAEAHQDDWRPRRE
jgi:hypothetical protein